MVKVSLLLVLATLAAGAEPGEVLLGHKDFYPSPEHPVGFRGDGNGNFPGATPVTEWREATIATKRDGQRESFITTDNQSVNVVWKVEMPDPRDHAG